jgi:hypothetical protein
MAVSNVSFYADESGSHGQGPFVLSGYLADDGTWGQFEEQWHAVLHNVSIGGHEMDYFHMRECFKLEEEFSNFTRSQADQKLNALVDVLRPFIRGGKIREFTCIIDWDIYNRALTGPAREAWYNPYLFAFGTILLESAKYVTATQKVRDPIYFFLDDQITKVEKTVAWQFENAKDTLPEKLTGAWHGVTFCSDKLTYPLQAADLIAWQRHRRQLDLPEDRGPLPQWKKLHAATPKGHTFLFPYNEKGFKVFSKKFQEKRDRLRAAE